MSSARSFLVFLMIFIFSCALPGCLNTVPAAKYNTVSQELLTTQEKTRKLETELNDARLLIKSLKSQTGELRQTHGGSLEDLVVPVKIQLERLSGGVDTDHKPGDDELILYVQPVDRDGSVIKAAGSLKITLFDLQNPPNQNVLAEYIFDVQHTRALWSGRLMTNHFTVKCPFPHPPAHDRITAEVVFTDLLTGNALTAQEVFTIKLAAQPASSAAK
jgi:hypothetical protein